MLPADGHVHSQFSWDAPQGDMHATCARAVAIGLPALAFTEHVDLTAWSLHYRSVPSTYRGSLDGHGRFLGGPLEVDAYLEEVDRCRHAFPDLRIWSGIELSEGHWHPDAVADLMSAVRPQRVVGSVHALADVHPDAALGDHVEVSDGYDQREPVEVVRSYLAEVRAMSLSDAPFEVLGHIDDPLRSWPASAGEMPWVALEDDFRAALEATAASGRALEVNTRLPLAARVLDWWHEAGGESVVFGSDAHRPDDVARQFAQTAAVVAAHGFRPGPTPYEHWRRT